MSGNPTAGILILLLASALLAIGLTDKGQQILSILLNKNVGTGSNSEYQYNDPTDYSKKTPKQSGGYSDKNPAPSVAGFVGEKGAAVLV